MTEKDLATIAGGLILGLLLSVFLTLHDLKSELETTHVCVQEKTK
jgi:hypothetical protein